MQAAALWATPRWRYGALGVVVAAVLVAVLVELRAQPGEDALVMSADQKLGDAVRAGDRSSARRLLSLQFSFVDETGKAYDRKSFLSDLKGKAAASAADVKVRRYGRVAMVTGHRHSAHDDDVFFLDIWAKQKGNWRALLMQDVAVAADDASASAAPSASAPAASVSPTAAPYECKNPCQALPYRVRSPAEQDIVNAFQAIERAAIAHDADAWSKHVADEFVLYGSGRAPIPKSGRIASIERQKADNRAVKIGEVETMRLSVYDDGAAMTAIQMVPGNARPPYRAARVWVKRGGQWQMAISVQTDVKPPAPAPSRTAAQQPQ